MKLARKNYPFRLSAKIKYDLKGYLYQIIGLTFLFISSFFFISIISYDPLDPSWNTVVDGPAQNMGGSLGAISADVIIQFLGKAGYFSVIALLLNGIFYLFKKKYCRSVVWTLIFIGFAQILLSCLLTLVFSNSMFIGGGLGLSSAYFLSLFSTMLPHPFTMAYLIIVLGILTFFVMMLALNLRLEDGRSLLRLLYLGTFGTYHYASLIFKSPYRFFSVLRNLMKKIPYPVREEASLLSETPSLAQEERDLSLFPFKEEEMTNESSVSPVTLKVVSSRPRERTPKLETPQPELDLECTYQLPSLGLLAPSPKENEEPTMNQSLLAESAKELMTVLEDFGIRGEITKVHPGPVVTLYELIPAPGIKASRVVGLADDIARSMSALSTRIAVIPGHNAIGIELPNKKRQTVYLRDLLLSHDYEISGPKLPLALGKDIGGNPIIADLARMPHLLVAGTTGSGKSVAINTMILSLLYRLSPAQCRFIMIDPKMLELSVYDGIPHLLSPVVTEPKKAVFALKWTVKEMEDRYRSMSKLGVRNIEGYNTRLAQAHAKGETLTRSVQTGFDTETGQPIFETQPLNMTPLPYIVVVVDEMADLMLVAGKDIEATVQRLAQMARAAGIHLIMATQRPSVDVITGTIKANFPTRISFQVTSRFDSRTILGEQGAEQLLGRGDMLYMEGGGKIQRVHGPFVSDPEVERVVNFLKSQAEPSYIDNITEEDTEVLLGAFKTEENKGDALYQQALELVKREQKASTSFIQRHLRIGYNTAARIIEQMESEGIVSQANHVGKREVLISA
jgi:S-DNA-T family DNA segregation ATPase FtsK/SpoIIIE